MDRDKAIHFPIYRVQNFCMLLPFIPEHLHYPSIGKRTVQLEYQASYQQCSLFWRTLFCMGELIWGHSHFGLVCHRSFCMLLPSPSEGYYNPSAYHPGFQQLFIYYSGAYIVWEEGTFTCGGRFGLSPYSSGRILACWDHPLHHRLIYIVVCTCIDLSYFIAS